MKKKWVGIGALIIAVTLLVGWISALAVEYTSGGDGEFGDWLGYWGNIIGSVIGAIVAALISYFITVTMQGKIDHQKTVDAYNFEIQTTQTSAILHVLKNMKFYCRESDEQITKINESKRLYQKGMDPTVGAKTQLNSYSFAMLVQMKSRIDFNSPSVTDLNRDFKKIENNDYYLIISKIKVDGIELGHYFKILRNNLNKLLNWERDYSQDIKTLDKSNSEDDTVININIEDFSDISDNELQCFDSFKKIDELPRNMTNIVEKAIDLIKHFTI